MKGLQKKVAAGRPAGAMGQVAPAGAHGPHFTFYASGASNRREFNFPDVIVSLPPLPPPASTLRSYENPPSPGFLFFCLVLRARQRFQRHRSRVEPSS